MMSGSTMSSATSTEPKAAAQPAPPPSALERVPWTLVTPLALGIAAAIYMFAIMSPRAPLSAGTVFLVVAAAAFGAVALQIWKSVAQLATPENKTPEAAKVASDRHRRELEKEKAAVLKAIKELEFDRAMNKISEEDYKDAHANYRQRAVRIMVQLDAGGSGYREIIEREIRERLERRGAKAPEPAKPAPPPAVEKDRTMCSCGTRNDADATFCKKCGAKL
jgi:hypothetical protein